MAQLQKKQNTLPSNGIGVPSGSVPIHTHHTNGVDAPLIMDGSNTYIQTYIRMDKRFEEQKRSHL